MVLISKGAIRLKRINKLVLIGLLTVTLSACGKEGGQADEKSIIEQTVSEQIRAEEMTSKEIVSEEMEAGIEREEIEIAGEKIEEQSFPVTLSQWGDVTFASFLPDENEYSEGDVCFKLLKGGNEIYSFPGFSEDNTRFNQQFVEIVAIAFRDCNYDDRTDIIIINKYVPISGPSMGDDYNEVRIYIQPEGEKEFIMNYPMAEYLMKQYCSDSIASIIEGLKYYPEYMESLEHPVLDENEFSRKVYEKYYNAMTEEEIIQMINERSSYYHASSYYAEISDYWENVRGVTDISNVMEPLFYSDMKYYTPDDFKDVPVSVIHLSKNEIYARHGYIFKDTDLENYFMGCIWYTPTCVPEDFKESVFNEYEKVNLNLLSELDAK